MLVAIYDCVKAVVTCYIKSDSERKGNDWIMQKPVYFLAKIYLVKMQLWHSKKCLSPNTCYNEKSINIRLCLIMKARKQQSFSFSNEIKSAIT